LRSSLFLCAILVGCGSSSSSTEAETPDVIVDDATDETSTDDTSVAIDSSVDETTTVDAPVVDATPDVSSDTFVPSCPATSKCPATPAVTEGGGPKAIDRCAFFLKDSGKAYAPIIAELEKTLKLAPIATVLGDLNRTATVITSSKLPGVPGFVRGIAWDTDDEDKAWWIPQGLTGSFDANAAGTVAGKKVVIATWYYDLAKQPGATAEKGIRISIADVTSGTPKYRHVLLVEPVMKAGRADFAPIVIHAGGAAWVGNRLWVADTGRGLRGFDLSRMLEVATDKEVIGWDDASSKYEGGLYAYVLPQTEAWNDGSPCNPVFSFVALDRTSTPPALVTGEYSATEITGKLLRFPVDATTGALDPIVYANDAYVMGQRQVQGGLTHEGVFRLSSSAPAAGGGVLYSARVGKSTLSNTWVDAPEDLMLDTVANQLWGLSEAEGKRYIFAVDATKLK
jgi:hypothetical protein